MEGIFSFKASVEIFYPRMLRFNLPKYLESMAAFRRVSYSPVLA